MEACKTKLLIIAGPQSSGKTTVFELLKKKYAKIKFIPEINPYAIAGNNHLGGAFVDAKLDKKIVDISIKKIAVVNKSYKTVCVETGPFHIAWLAENTDQKTVDVYFLKYLKALKPFEPTILFIDTKPAVSFRRRKNIYLSRIKKAGINDRREKKRMLNKYENKIKRLYPLLIKYYKKLPFAKIMIRNSYKSFRQFKNEVYEAAEKFIRS